MPLRLLLAAALALLLAGCAAQTGDSMTASGPSPMVGTFDGKIMSNSLIPAMTRIAQDKDMSLRGDYLMHESGGDVPGKLSSCKPTGERGLRCRWTDKYGSGTLRVTFNEDFSAFEGTWSADGSTKNYAWNGARR